MIKVVCFIVFAVFLVFKIGAKVLIFIVFDDCLSWVLIKADCFIVIALFLVLFLGFEVSLI